MLFKDLLDVAVCPLLVCKASGKPLTTIYNNIDLKRFDKYIDEELKLANAEVLKITTLDEEIIKVEVDY